MPNKKKGKGKKSLQQAKKAAQKKANLRESKNEKTSVANGSTQAPPYTVQQLLHKAEECATRLMFDLAVMFSERALDIEPDHVTALEQSGKWCMEADNPERAYECFTRAVELSPSAGFSKFMYLGQLTGGPDAVLWFRKGLSIMEKSLMATNSEEVSPPGGSSDQSGLDPQDKATARLVSNGYLSIAELYLTDLCDLEEAKGQCLDSIEKALQTDPVNPAALQLKAEYLLVDQQPQEAKEAIERSVDLWWPKVKAEHKDMIREFSQAPPTEQVSNGNQDGDGDEAMEVLSDDEDGDDDEPESGDDTVQQMEEDDDGDEKESKEPVVSEGEELTMEMKIKSVQTLTEVGSHELACDILELLLQWNEDSVQIWYMLGLNNYLHGNEHWEEAGRYLTQALECAARSEEDPQSVKDMTGHCKELLKEIKSSEVDQNEQTS